MSGRYFRRLCAGLKHVVVVEHQGLRTVQKNVGSS